MDVLDSVLGGQAGEVVNQVSRQFGLDPSQASSALAVLLPAVAAGFKNNASTPSGLDGLLEALGSGGHQQYVNEIDTLGRPGTIDDGNGILGHIFGGKEVSRQVAQRAATQSGVNPDVLKRMLPIVAALVMGALARQRSAGASPGGAGQVGAATGGGGLFDVLTPMLDANRDGSMVDDVIGMIGRYMGGR